LLATQECFQYVCQEFWRVRQLCDSRVARTWGTLGVTSSLSGERSTASATKETNSQLKAALEGFQHSASNSMTFPSTLTAAQVRACVRAIGWSAIFDQVSGTLYVVVGSNIQIIVCVFACCSQRRFVHQQATHLGLKSRSSGSDGDRHISTSLDLGRQVTVYKLNYESD
jgi:hypothetical protein